VILSELVSLDFTYRFVSLLLLLGGKETGPKITPAFIVSIIAIRKSIFWYAKGFSMTQIVIVITICS
jgi:hypothetical protein